MFPRFRNVPLLLLATASTVLSALQFPIEEVYGLSSGHDMGIQNNITLNHLCEGSVYERSCCYCDEYCLHFKDCCIDRLWNETWKDVGTYMDYFEKQMTKSKVTECLPVVRDLAAGDQSEGVLMVSSCRPGFGTAESKRLCSSEEAVHMPVFGSDMYVHKNADCAICNGVESFEILNITVECIQRLLDGDKRFPHFSQCKYVARIQPQFSQYIRRCSLKDYPVRTCPEFKQSNVPMRNFYKGNVLGSREVSYYNVDVLRCNNGLDSDFSVPECDKVIPEVSPVRFSLLISFGKDVRLVAKDGSREIGVSEPKCPVDEVYDAVHGKCLPFVCGSGYMKVNSMCVRVATPLPRNKSVDGAEILSPDQLTNYCLLQTDSSLVVEAKASGDLSPSNPLFTFIQDEIEGDTSLIHPPFAVLVKRTLNETLIAKLNGFLASVKNYPEALADVASVYLLSVRPASVQLHQTDLRHAFSGQRTCARFLVHNMTSAILDEKCSLHVGNTTYQASEFVIHSRHEVPSGNVLATYFVTCDLFYAEKPCAMRLYTNYTQHENLSITLWDNSAEITIPFEEYVPLEKGIGVCVPTKSELRQRQRLKDTISDVEFGLTVACALVSAICYIITIITYSCFKDLRTVPGHNIVALCLALLLSDILVLSTVAAHTAPVACRNVGILLHWLLLAALAWSTVISFEIWLTFHIRIRRNASSTRRFVYYILYAVSMPTFLVVVAVLVDAGGKLEMGYGAERVCWITNLNGRIIFYVTPFAISWTLNFLVLLTTITLVYRQQRKAAKLLNKVVSHEIKLARTATKLIVLLGVVELVGFIQLPGKNTSVEIVNAIFALAFTVLRGLRGFFIALMYVFCDQKVRSIIHSSKISTTIVYSRSLRSSLPNISFRKGDAVVLDVYKNSTLQEVAV